VVVAACLRGAQHVAEGDHLLVDVGDLDADRRLPGIGDRIRTSALATAYEMLRLSAVTFSTLTAGPSSTS
jgi:hypothetical protein